MAKYAGIMYRAGDKVLLVKRAPGEHNYPNTWAFPGGHIESGETPEDGARREFMEEVGHTAAGELSPLQLYGEFQLYGAVGPEFIPTLNDEHTDFLWALPDRLPEPIHPGTADQIRAHAMDYADTARVKDLNGYVTIFGNPISRAGVFQYMGKSIPGADPTKVYNVLRPAEELSKPEALESLKLLPIYNEHEMTGDGYPTAPEDKGIHGSTGEDISFDGKTIFAKLRIFSRTLKSIIDSGKKGLSLGYRCTFEKSSGVFEGLTYHYIQRNIRGDHLALVNEGRCGTAVLDNHWVFDHFDLALDNREQKGMADDDKKKDADAKDNAATGEGDGDKEMTLAEITAAVRALQPLMKTVQEFMAAGAAKTDAATTLDADDADKDKGKDKDKKDGDAKDAGDDDKKDKDKKGEGMDAAEINDLKTRMAAMEKRGSKEMLSTMASREKLVKEVTPLTGTFDHAEMTAEEVAVYACDKLDLKPEKGQELSTLKGFLAGRQSGRTGAIAAFAMDTKPKQGGLLAKRLGTHAVN